MWLEFGFVIIWWKDFGAKAAHKMLVKLTPERQSSGNYKGHREGEEYKPGAMVIKLFCLRHWHGGAISFCVCPRQGQEPTVRVSRGSLYRKYSKIFDSAECVYLDLLTVILEILPFAIFIDWNDKMSFD
jgi:hypothetical protein